MVKKDHKFTVQIISVVKVLFVIYKHVQIMIYSCNNLRKSSRGDAIAPSVPPPPPHSVSANKVYITFSIQKLSHFLIQDNKKLHCHCTPLTDKVVNY